MGKIIRIGPQKGPQERFLATSADICIYGGAAGGGKTFGLLLEPIRHMNNKNYNAVIFRSNYTQVTSPGGLWDSSGKIYSLVKGAYPLKTPKLHWTFKSGATVNFAHLARKRLENCDMAQMLPDLQQFSVYAYQTGESTSNLKVRKIEFSTLSTLK